MSEAEETTSSTGCDMHDEAFRYLSLRRLRDKHQKELEAIEELMRSVGSALLEEMDKTGTTVIPVSDEEGSGKIVITETGVKYREPTPEELRHYLGDGARSYIVEKVLGEAFRKEAPPEIVAELAPKVTGRRSVQLRVEAERAPVQKG
jgi:hypothetical protein